MWMAGLYVQLGLEEDGGGITRPSWMVTRGLSTASLGAIRRKKRAIRVVYSDTDSDYEIALIVAGMDLLKDRREMLMARFLRGRS